MSLDMSIQVLSKLLGTFGTTCIITVVAFAVGQVFSVPIAFALRSPNFALRWPASAYTFVIRGTPLLVQLFIIYYGLPRIPGVRTSMLWPLLRDPMTCAIAGIGLNSAAYTAALLRGAIDTVPSGQAEAARMLGLSTIRTYGFIVLPQAYRAVFPAIANEFILVMKASALASTVSVLDVTGMARSLVAQTYAAFQIFISAGAIYFVFGSVVAQLFRIAERRLYGPATDREAPASSVLRADQHGLKGMTS